MVAGNGLGWNACINVTVKHRTNIRPDPAEVPTKIWKVAGVSDRSRQT